MQTNWANQSILYAQIIKLKKDSINHKANAYNNRMGY